MHSIALIIPYFGEWPVWVDLFFHSCTQNATINFFFFTDCPKPEIAERTKNLHFNKMSFGQYCDLVSKKLDIDFHPNNAYKLCDLKPFYGIVHSDILSDYDFWGFEDIDLILGDLRLFFTEDVLCRYDVISNHSDRISGHLSLIRNDERLNTIPLLMPKWKQRLTSEKHYAMDEIDFTRKLYPSAIIMWKIHKYIFLRFPFRNEFQSHVRFCTFFNRLMMPQSVYFKERFTTPWFNESDFLNSEVLNNNRWESRSGHIFDMFQKKELPYLHFLGMKKYWPIDFFQVKKTCDDVMINLKGIYNI